MPKRMKVAMNKLTLDALKAAIDEAQRIVLTVHVHPDGDAVGGLLGMYEALVNYGKDVTMIVDDVIPEKFHFLQYADAVLSAADVEHIEGDMLLVLDASTYERIGRVGPLCKGMKLYNIDHHISNSEFADGLYLRPDFAATGEIIAFLCGQWNWPITPSMGNALYTAIATDCGFFKFSNTTAHTLTMAAHCVAAGAQPNVVSEHVELTTMSRIEVMKQALQTVQFFKNGKVATIELNQALMAQVGDDTDGYVDLIRNVEGVDVAILLKAYGPETTRVSLRSKTIDVNAIAGGFGGGGHIRAAGCTLELPLAQARETLVKAVP